MCVGFHVKYLLLLSDFNENWTFSTDFSTNTQISNLIKIRSIGAEKAHADGLTDMTKLMLVFRNFANAPKNASFTHIHIHFIQNLGIPMKVGSYAVVILELCRGRQSFESHWSGYRTRSWLKPCAVREAIHYIHLCRPEISFILDGTSTEMRIRYLNASLAQGRIKFLAPLGSENISAPYFKQCFFQGGGITPQTESNTTPPSPKTEITNILFYILNFASIIKFKI